MHAKLETGPLSISFQNTQSVKYSVFHGKTKNWTFLPAPLHVGEGHSDSPRVCTLGTASFLLQSHGTRECKPFCYQSQVIWVPVPHVSATKAGKPDVCISCFQRSTVTRFYCESR